MKLKFTRQWQRATVLTATSVAFSFEPHVYYTCSFFFFISFRFIRDVTSLKSFLYAGLLVEV